MSLQEEMFTEVAQWMASGITKSDFLKGKQYTEAKFNYWIAKWKAGPALSDPAGFEELGFSEAKLGKVLEIEMPSGVKISVFA